MLIRHLAISFTNLAGVLCGIKRNHDFIRVKVYVGYGWCQY